ncbi:MAG: hypothetical protein IPM91_21145 [Bacteroidetes bacterium]|nr:hypothetical protein [Bacteroidota bacterium]
MKKLIFIALLICIKSIANAQQLSISNPNAPDRVGERILTFNCPLDGLAKRDIEVWVYYSTNKSDLASENCPSGRASCSKIAGDPSKCYVNFIFLIRIMINQILFILKKRGQNHPQKII